MVAESVTRQQGRGRGNSRWLVEDAQPWWSSQRPTEVATTQDGGDPVVMAAGRKKELVPTAACRWPWEAAWWLIGEDDGDSCRELADCRGAWQGNRGLATVVRKTAAADRKVEHGGERHCSGDNGN
ncbi:long-chain fatty acid--CoA ligase [Sesbania bispinosa]|nr:long-chain fatty acid--CoA ligase [Sesbania bispinosa]